MISRTGLNISDRIRVESESQLAEVLREASSVGTPVLPVGGGTCVATGFDVAEPFLELDLTGLNGLIDYIPTDMTAGFRAGTSIKVVRKTLAENGQELPVDLADDDGGTIGGLVATGFAGPRRYGQGTLKDLLIGCEYIRADGLVAKAGGMTVKNVSGFEISRMLHGSWGALAVLTRVNLKVIPKSRADRTLTWADADAEAAIERQARLLESFPGATALQSRQLPDRWQTAIRFTGRESAVDAYESEAVAREGAPESVNEVSMTWIAEPCSPNHPQLVVSGSMEISRQIVRDLLAAEIALDMTVSLGTGTIRARLNTHYVTAENLLNLASPLWMIEGGESDWKQMMPVWGPERADRQVMQAIKNQFDPAGILNRGRLFI